MKKIFFLLFIISGCSKELKNEQADTFSEQQTTAAMQSRVSIPDQLRFTVPGLYPEGIAWDKFNNRFLVSSFGQGTIGAVSVDGVYTPFIQNADVHSTLGLRIDEARKRVVAAVPDGFSDVAKVGVWDLNTGNRIWLIDLASLYPGSIHLADDLTIDPQGNIYITDVKAPVIYKVDVNGQASVFFTNQYFAMPLGFPYPDLWTGFNGIAYDNSGFLIVSFYVGALIAKPSLVKIPINDPQNFSGVQLDFTPTFPDFSFDGILLSRDGKELIGANNAFLAAPMDVVHLTSNDHWNSAHRIETFPTGFTTPTNATTDGKNIFVIYSFLYDIFFGVPNTNTEFIIQKIPFENTQGF